MQSRYESYNAAKETYKHLTRKHIWEKEAKLYLAICDFEVSEESDGNINAAVMTLQRGIQRGAKPDELLREKLEELVLAQQQSRTNKTSSSTEDNANMESLLNSTSSSSSVVPRLGSSSRTTFKSLQQQQQKMKLLNNKSSSFDDDDRDKDDTDFSFRIGASNSSSSTTTKNNSTLNPGIDGEETIAISSSFSNNTREQTLTTNATSTDTDISFRIGKSSNRASGASSHGSSNINDNTNDKTLAILPSGDFGKPALTHGITNVSTSNNSKILPPSTSSSSLSSDSKLKTSRKRISEVLAKNKQKSSIRKKLSRGNRRIMGATRGNFSTTDDNDDEKVKTTTVEQAQESSEISSPARKKISTTNNDSNSSSSAISSQSSFHKVSKMDLSYMLNWDPNTFREKQGGGNANANANHISNSNNSSSSEGNNIQNKITSDSSFMMNNNHNNTATNNFKTMDKIVEESNSDVYSSPSADGNTSNVTPSITAPHENRNKHNNNSNNDVTNNSISTTPTTTENYGGSNNNLTSEISTSGGGRLSNQHQLTQQQRKQSLSSSLSSQNTGTSSGRYSDSNNNINHDFLPLVSEDNMLYVNSTPYAKLGVIGKGGSCKVYRALSKDCAVLAIKKVKLDGVDKKTIDGYANEISLLKKLRGNPAIIQMYDSQVDLERQSIFLVMELGEVDLNHVLQHQSNKHSQQNGRERGVGQHPRLNMNFIRLTWQQMLSAVHCIHEERIIHSDLKPANFLFVRGALKLIDFGIAKAIQSDDTTNITRDSQIGTLNYMSPEAFLDTGTGAGQKARMKLGRVSSSFFMLGRQSYYYFFIMIHTTTLLNLLLSFSLLSSLGIRHMVTRLHIIPNGIRAPPFC